MDCLQWSICLEPWYIALYSLLDNVPKGALSKREWLALFAHEIDHCVTASSAGWQQQQQPSLTSILTSSASSSPSPSSNSETSSGSGEQTSKHSSTKGKVFRHSKVGKNVGGNFNFFQHECTCRLVIKASMYLSLNFSFKAAWTGHQRLIG